MTSPSTSPIKDYITFTLDEIQNSLKDNAVIDGSVKFEKTTVSERRKGGKINVGVLNVGAGIGKDISENQTQKVSFAIKFPTDAEIASLEAEKAKAEVTIVHSNKLRDAWNDPNIRALPREPK